MQRGPQVKQFEKSTLFWAILSRFGVCTGRRPRVPRASPRHSSGKIRTMLGLADPPRIPLCSNPSVRDASSPAPVAATDSTNLRLLIVILTSLYLSGPRGTVADSLERRQ